MTNSSILESLNRWMGQPSCLTRTGYTITFDASCRNRRYYIDSDLLLNISRLSFSIKANNSKTLAGYWENNQNYFRFAYYPESSQFQIKSMKNGEQKKMTLNIVQKKVKVSTIQFYLNSCNHTKCTVNVVINGQKLKDMSALDLQFDRNKIYPILFLQKKTKSITFLKKKKSAGEKGGEGKKDEKGKKDEEREGGEGGEGGEGREGGEGGEGREGREGGEGGEGREGREGEIDVNKPRLYHINKRTGVLSDTVSDQTTCGINPSNSKPSRFALINEEQRAFTMNTSNELEGIVALLPSVYNTLIKTPNLNTLCAATWENIQLNPAFYNDDNGVAVDMSDPKSFFTYLKNRPESTCQPFDIVLSSTEQKVVAIGDLHADIDALLRTLWNARLINAGGSWIGGTIMVVQLGDQIDRVRPWVSSYNIVGRYPEIEVLWYTELLKNQAKAVGGEFYSLLGNHEMYSANPNAPYTFYPKYVSESDLKAYNHKFTENLGINVDYYEYPSGEKANRYNLFKGGGLIAKKLFASRGLAVKIENVVFSHADVGGVNAANFGGIKNTEQLNELAYAYLTTGNHDSDTFMRIGVDSDAYDSYPVWNRNLCYKNFLDTLQNDTFTYVSAHSPKNNISNPVPRVWCIDTQRSAGFGSSQGSDESLLIDFSTRNTPVFAILGAAKQRS